MKAIRGLAIFLLILGAIYLVGPRVENPELNNSKPNIPSQLDALQDWIQTKEAALENIKPDNESKIFFMIQFLKRHLIVSYICMAIQLQGKRVIPPTE